MKRAKRQIEVYWRKTKKSLKTLVRVIIKAYLNR